MSRENLSPTGTPIDRPSSDREPSSGLTEAANARTVRVKLGPSIAVDDPPFRDFAPAPKLLTNLLPSLPGYELIEELGTGGNGVVYKAKHISLGRIVALKTHFSGAFVDPEHLTRLRNEAQALAKLQHPNIVQIYEVGEDAGRPYLALEYCRGGTLSRKLDGKPWEPVRAAALVATLADAVQAAHTAGVIHRDLKPGNILLQNEESRTPTSKIVPSDRLVRRNSDSQETTPRFNSVPKISDFGLARPCDGPTGMTTAGVALGTPSYMPPEQARGELDKLGPLVDVYALGAVLYELLTGRPPFLGHNDYETVHQVIFQEPVSPRTWIPELPRDLETICLKCLQKNPVARYASAHDLQEDLTRFVNGEPVLARPIGVITRAGRWAKRRPAAAGLIAVSLLAFVLAVGLTVMLSHWLRVSEEQRAESDRLRLVALMAENRSEKLREKAERSAQQTRAALDDMLSEQALSWLSTQLDLLPQQREFLKRALKYYEEMAAEDGGPESHYIHAMAHFRVARILDALGRAEESANAYERAVAVMETLVQQHPDDARFANSLAKCLINRGIMQKMSLRFPEGEVLLRRGIEVAGAIAKQYPDVVEYRVDYGKGLLNLAGLLFDSQRPQLVGELTQQAIDVFAKIHAEIPDNTDAQECLAHCYTVLSKQHQWHGRYVDAETASQQATDIYESLAKMYPNVVTYKAMLAARLNATSHLASDLNKLEEAEKTARRSAEIREALARQFPNVPEHRNELSSSLNNLGITLHLRGRLAEAEKAYLRALEVRNALAKEGPLTLPDRASLAALHVNVAVIADRTGRRPMAEENYRRAIALREEIILDEKTPDKFRIECAQALSAFANFLAEKNTSGECHEYYRRAGELYKPLVEKYSSNSDLMIAYGGFCCNFANLQQARGDNRTAHDWFDTAINHLQPLVDHELRWKDARVYLSNSYLGRSVSRRFLNRLQDSLTDLDKCEKWDDSTAKQRIVIRNRAATLLAAGEREKAGQLADQLAAAQPPSVESFFAAACTWAMIAGKDDEGACQRAVELLRRTLALMPKPDRELLSHRDFDLLRDRADFQALKTENPKGGE